MGILDKLKQRGSRDTETTPSSKNFPHAPSSLPLTSSLRRYRKQRGLNLGSWFVLERWITSEPFRNAANPGQSDHNVARGKDAKTILEKHWDEWIREEDWKWMKEKGFNSVRIPIGYYHLCKAIPDVLKGTDFEAHYEVFEGAWERIVRAIEKAGQYGIGVLIDLHAAAGAQNADAHSGLSSGKPKLFSSSTNLRSTSLALRFLASTLCSKPNVIGLEILNEPANNPHLQKWYDTTLNEIRQVAPVDFPIYISDAWDTGHYSEYVGKRDDFVVLDHHLYRCFTDEDSSMNGTKHAEKIRAGFSGQLGGHSGSSRGNIVVGEWSASLSDKGLGGMNDGEKDAQRREFVKAQLELFEGCTGGWWFWTYKKREGWDAGWCARDASRAEILPSWVGSRQFKGPPPSHIKDQALSQAHNSHTQYWQNNGGSPNPAVFAPGYSQGWDDALLFLSARDGVSELGFIEEWARRRRSEYESKGDVLGKAAWEWEHGFKQGVVECQKACLQ